MIHFLFGEDTWSLTQEIKNLKKKAAEQGAMTEELALSKDQTDSALKARLQEMFSSMSLFSTKKLVLLRDFLNGINKFSDSEEYLLNFSKTPSQSPPHEGEKKEEVTVVFVQDEMPDKRLKFFKTLQKKAEIREFSIPAGKALENWIGNYLNEAGFKMEPQALTEFVNLLSGQGEETLHDLWQVSSELEKLMLLKTPSQSPPHEGEKKEEVIGLADVREIVRPNIGYNVFTLTNLFAEGRGVEAVGVLEKMMEGSASLELKSEVIQIVGALAGQIRSLLLVKDLENQSPAGIAKTLNWKEGRVWINLKLAKKFRTDKLKNLLRDLRALDLRLKTSEEPPKLLLSLFLLRRSQSEPRLEASGQKAKTNA